MSTPKVNSFTSYALSIEQELRGQVLTPENLQVLQNLKAVTAEEILALRFDPEHTLQFVQQNAELQGKLGILDYLIECNAFASNQILSSQDLDVVDRNQF